MRVLKKGLQKCDLFSTSQFLRYKGEQDYRTATGGFCSLIVVVVFMVLFTNTAIQTAQMTNITWTSSTSSLFDPSKTALTISPKSFMFAVGILGVNLNNATHRFFDITIIDRQISRGNVQMNSTVISMVPCTVEHFSVNDQIRQSFSTLPNYRWLCPPLGFSFGIHGKYTSKTMQLLQISVKKCNDSLDPTRPCVSDQMIANLQANLAKFDFSIFYINPLINPGDQNYLSYYLQDRNYVSFTRKIGGESNGFIEDFEVVTDASLLPFSKNIIDQGIIIKNLFQNVAYQVTDSNYARYYLLKSSSSTTYQRQFTKLDTFFSYVGGLVGTILGFMIIVTKYTQFSFELSLSQRLFSYKTGENRKFSPNLISYAQYLFYWIFKSTHFCKQSQTIKSLFSCREQVTKQLNLDLILRRITFLQIAVEAFLNDNQIEGLHMQQHQTLSNVRKRRKRYGKRQQEQKNSSSSSAQSDDDQDNDENRNKSTAQMNQFITNHIQGSFGEIKDQLSKKKEVKKDKLISKQLVLKQLRIEAENGNQISRNVLNRLDIGKDCQQKIESKIVAECKEIHLESQIIKQDEFLFIS